MSNNQVHKLLSNYRFVPEEVSDKDLHLFLKKDEYDILLQESQTLLLVDSLLESKANLPSGSIVECGVWKGGTLGIIKAIVEEVDPKRSFHLLDFFGESLYLDFKKLKKKERLLIEQNKNFEYDFPNLKEVKEFLASNALLDSTINFYQGNILDTIPKLRVKEISILHLDLDFYYTTYFALENLYKNVVSGGITLINDYGLKSVECGKAVDEFRKKMKVKSKLIRIGDHMAYWIKE